MATVQRVRKAGVSATIIVVAIASLGLLAYGIVGSVRAARLAARQSSSNCRLKQLGIALHNYHDQCGTFPPAYFTDADGKPMHSWRVLLLPYFEEQGLKDLYRQYRFEEPWNSPHNQQLADKTPRLYHSPCDTGHEGEASYLAVVGNETGWPAPQAVTIKGIGDGTVNTIALVEVANSGINWLNPRDLSLDESLKNDDSQHATGAMHLFFDGSVHFLKRNIDRKVYRALLTANGQEVVTLPE